MDYDTWYRESPMEFKKKIVEDFIKKTQDYARIHIETRRKEITDHEISDLGEKIYRLLKWTGYLEFQEHTLNELQGDKLDRYFL